MPAPPPTRPLLLPVLRRLGWFVATLVGSAVFVQGLFALAPGDAIDLLPDSDTLRESLSAEWGLDLPLPVRLGRTLAQLATGDLGTSLTYRPGTPVLELVLQGGAQSLGLLAPALILGLGTALALAIWRPPLLRWVQVVSVVPAFLGAFLTVTAINATVWALIGAGWIDRPDWFALPDQASALRTALAIVVLAYASGGLAELHQATDAELTRVRRAPFIEAARARGEPVLPHFVSNLLPPLLDLAATRVPAVLSALVVVEKLLLLNGAGAMLWQACLKRDFPLAIGIGLAAAALVAAFRLTIDLARLALDPRLRANP